MYGEKDGLLDSQANSAQEYIPMFHDQCEKTKSAIADTDIIMTTTEIDGSDLWILSEELEGLS